MSDGIAAGKFQRVLNSHAKDPLANGIPARFSVANEHVAGNNNGITGGRLFGVVPDQREWIAEQDIGATNMLMGKSIGTNWRAWSVLAAMLGAISVLSACGGGGNTNVPVAGGGGGGGGGGPVVIPPPACVLGANPNITISLAASRISGVAPLAVFFDASATVSTVFPTRPFHELGFSWNFGESTGPGIAAWGRGARPGASRNVATGPLAAHVFETPGTYNVCVTVTDGTNTADGVVVITVDDPDVVFAGTNTICVGQTVAPTVGVNSCPATAAVQVATDFKAVMDLATTGKRILLQRGDVWGAPSLAATPRLSSTGPGIVGAFGAGAAPRIVPLVAGGNTILAISGGASPNITDWRFMDLEFDGLSGLNSNGVAGGGGAQQMTFVRMHIHDISNGIQFNAQALDILPGHNIYDQITVYDSRIERVLGSGGNGMFLQARRLAILGNLVEDTRNLAEPGITNDGEHIIRIQYASKAVLQANDLGLQSVGKSVLTVRAVNVGTGGVTAPNNTEQVVVTENLFRGGEGSGIISFQPSASTENQLIGNIIFDGNMIRAGATTQTAFNSSADEVTVRNNVFNLTGGTAYNCMSFSQQGAEPAHSNIRILNNTCFSNDAGSGAPPTPTLRVVILDATNNTVSIANNLGYAPNMTTPPTFLLNSGSTGVTGAGGTFGNSSDAQILGTSPNFVNAGGANASDYAVNSPSYAINGGVAVPVFTDIFRNPRPAAGSFDIGAAEQ